MKKKFGIDIDDTILEVWEDELIKKYNKKYNKNFVFEDLENHNFNNNEDLKKEFFDYYYKNHSDMKLFSWVKEKLSELKEKYELFLITSRPKKDIAFTKRDIVHLFWEDFFEEIIFSCEYWEDKKCIISNEKKFDVVIDDAPHHIENYINNTEIKKIIIFDKPWNKQIKEDNKRVFRVQNWSEINI